MNDTTTGISVAGASRRAATLITGANGEFGHGLIRRLHAEGSRDLVALDIRELDPELRALCRDSFVGDITDPALLDRLLTTYEIGVVYHLAALLSTRSEFKPAASARGQRRRHAAPIGTGGAAGQFSGPEGAVPLSELDRGVRSAGSGDQGARRKDR